MLPKLLLIALVFVLCGGILGRGFWGVKGQLRERAKESTVRMVAGLTIGLKVSAKSTPGH
jgi:hypothetical protein